MQLDVEAAAAVMESLELSSHPKLPLALCPLIISESSRMGKFCMDEKDA